MGRVRGNTIAGAFIVGSSPVVKLSEENKKGQQM